jgi:hypothetical protein
MKFVVRPTEEGDRRVKHARGVLLTCRVNAETAELAREQPATPSCAIAIEMISKRIPAPNTQFAVLCHSKNQFDYCSKPITNYISIRSCPATFRGAATGRWRRHGAFSE